jgi:hypothetical protein
MNWDIWEKIEKILIQHGGDPILAVVPNNKDKNAGGEFRPLNPCENKFHAI